MRGFFCTQSTRNLLAARANPKELKLVSDCFEPVPGGNPLFQFVGKTFLQLDYIRAPRADQMVMMAVIALVEQLESSRAGPELEPFNHTHLFQEVDRTVNGRQIAVARPQLFVDLLDSQRSVKPSQ